MIATVTSSDCTSGSGEEHLIGPGRNISLPWTHNKRAFLFSSLFLTPKDEDLHVNENSRKRKIRRHYGASGRKGRRRAAAGKSRMRSILRSLHKTGGRRPQTTSPSANGSMSWYLQPSRTAHPRALVPEGWLRRCQRRGHRPQRCLHLKTMVDSLFMSHVCVSSGKCSPGEPRDFQ